MTLSSHDQLRSSFPRKTLGLGTVGADFRVFRCFLRDDLSRPMPRQNVIPLLDCIFLMHIMVLIWTLIRHAGRVCFDEFLVRFLIAVASWVYTPTREGIVKRSFPVVY